MTQSYLDVQLLIDGEWTQATGGRTIAVTDPATGEEIGTVAWAGLEVEAGMLTINHLGLALPEVPFGGTTDSGYGTEGGSEAIEAYLDTRFVTRVA